MQCCAQTLPFGCLRTKLYFVLLHFICFSGTTTRVTAFSLKLHPKSLKTSEKPSQCKHAKHLGTRIGVCHMMLIMLRPLRSVLQHSFGLRWKLLNPITTERLGRQGNIVFTTELGSSALHCLTFLFCRHSTPYVPKSINFFSNRKEVGGSVSITVLSGTAWVAQPQIESRTFTLAVCFTFFQQTGAMGVHILCRLLQGKIPLSPKQSPIHNTKSYFACVQHFLC